MFRKGSLSCDPARGSNATVRGVVHVRARAEGAAQPRLGELATSTSRRAALGAHRPAGSELVADPGYVVFYTNYDSRKGHEIAANPRVAGLGPLGRAGAAGAARGPRREIARRRKRRVLRKPGPGQQDRRLGQPAERATRIAQHAAEARGRTGGAFGTTFRARRTGAAIGCGPRRSNSGTRAAFRVHDSARWTRSLARGRRDRLRRRPVGRARGSTPEPWPDGPSSARCGWRCGSRCSLFVALGRMAGSSTQHRLGCGRFRVTVYPVAGRCWRCGHALCRRAWDAAEFR